VLPRDDSVWSLFEDRDCPECSRLDELRLASHIDLWKGLVKRDFPGTPANRKCHGDGAEIPSMRQAPSGFTYVQASPIPSRTGRLRETAGVPTVLRRWPHALGSPRGPAQVR
jgi:hypothetical protein